MLPDLFHFAFADWTPPFTLVGKLGLEAFTLQLQVGPLKSSRWGKGRRFFRARRLKRYSWSQSHESRVYWFELLTRIEVFEIIPCSQVCWWTPRRPLTQQACQRSVPGIGLSEIFLDIGKSNNLHSEWKNLVFTWLLPLSWSSDSWLRLADS